MVTIDVNVVIVWVILQDECRVCRVCRVNQLFSEKKNQPGDFCEQSSKTPYTLHPYIPMYLYYYCFYEECRVILPYIPPYTKSKIWKIWRNIEMTAYMVTIDVNVVIVWMILHDECRVCRVCRVNQTFFQKKNLPWDFNKQSSKAPYTLHPYITCKFLVSLYEKQILRHSLFTPNFYKIDYFTPLLSCYLWKSGDLTL